MKTRLVHALMSATVALGALTAAVPAHATPQDIHVTDAMISTDPNGRGAHSLIMMFSEAIPLGVHGTITVSACGQVLGTMPFIGRRPGDLLGSGVIAKVNGVLVSEYGYTIRFSDPTMPTLEGTKALDYPDNYPPCELVGVNPTSTDFNEEPVYNEVPYDYIVNPGKTKVNGKSRRSDNFKVGDKVTVTKPRLSLEAKTYKAKVSYEWTTHRVTKNGRVKGTKVVGTGPKVKVKRSWKNKILSVTLIVTDGIFKHPASTTVGVGGTGWVR